jgi:hypothetical protein
MHNLLDSETLFVGVSYPDKTKDTHPCLCGLNELILAPGETPSCPKKIMNKRFTNQNN